jgi:sortase A
MATGMAGPGGASGGGGPLYVGPRLDDEDFPPLGLFRRILRETGLALIVLGLIVLLFVAYQLLGTNLTEQHHQSHLKKSFESALSTPPTTAPPPAVTTPPAVKGGGADNPTVSGGPSAGILDTAIPTGAAVDHLTIPDIGVDKYVVQGTSEDDLSMGPGHYPSTPLPGEIGNAAIAGHRTTYGAPFFRLNNLKTGDDIFITDTADRHFTYAVTTMKVVSPSDVSVLDPTKTAELTLTTCNPRFGDSTRLVVVAKLVAGKVLADNGAALPTPPKAKGAKTKGKGAATTTTVPGASTTTVPGETTTTVPGPTTTTPASAVTTTVPTTTVPSTSSTTLARSSTALAAVNLGEGDHGARAPAILYGALVVLLWILTRLAIHHTHRWKRSASYVVGIGICLIPLWFCFENVVRLLPPNI